MRIALVSPYSWTYPGGVTRHIEALADEFTAAGHEPRIITPFDPDDRLAVRLHRGVRPQAREHPSNLVSLGRTIGLRANGAVSNVALMPSAAALLRRELRDGDYDVVHIHEPIVPLSSWDAVGFRGLPLVGTFHTYSTNRSPTGWVTSPGPGAASTAWRCGSPSPAPRNGPASGSSAGITA